MQPAATPSEPVAGAPWRGALAWAAVAAGFGASVALLEPSLLEEGIVVHAAERMAAGEHLYRDIVLFTAPLPYELLALLFRAFGAEIELARAALVALQALAAGLLFACARRAGLGVSAHAAAAAVASAPPLHVPLLSTFFYTTLAWYLSVCALWAALRAGEHRGFAAAAGALVGAVALCKQHTGALLALGFALALWHGTPAAARRRCLGAYVAGGAGLALATLAFYALRGDLAALWQTQIALPLSLARTSSYSTFFIDMWPPGRLDPASAGLFVLYAPSIYSALYGYKVAPGIIALTQALYALPFAALAATALRALPRWRPAHRLVWLHGALLLAATANLYPRPDWGHLYVALTPAIVQLLLLPAAAAPRRESALRGAVAVYAAGALLAAGLWSALALRSVAADPPLGPRVPLRPVSYANRNPALSRVTDYLLPRLEPGEPLFVPRQEPLLYYATRTRNPTPFPGVLPGLRELQEPVILAGLEGVRFIVMSDLDQPSHTYYREELPAVQDYLERHFEIPPDYPLDDYSWIFVAERGRDRGATAIDLIAERPRARGFVLDAQGREQPAPPFEARLGARQLMRPLAFPLGPLGGGVDYELLVPPDAQLHAGVGFFGLAAIDVQYLHAPEGRVFAAIGRDGRFEELVAVEFGEGAWPGRQWTPVALDLSRFAGERVTLRLGLKAPREIPFGFRMSWWGSPRITRGAAADGER
jgi:hypothetical protein